MSVSTPPPFDLFTPQSSVPRVATPPPYADEAQDALLKQLSEMKAAMEQLQREKEEAKKAEEAEKKQKEEAAKQQEEKEIQEFHKPMRETVQGIVMSPNHPYNKYRTQLTHFEKKGENVIEFIGWRQGDALILDMILTDKALYRVYLPKKGTELTPLYTFSQPLTIKQLRMLRSFLDMETIEIPNNLSGQQYRLMKNLLCEYLAIQNSPGYGGQTIFIRNTELRKKFESVLRLIPGSYQNGPWRQLDGFFGMYFNEETMEVTEIPPPSIH